MRAKSGSPGAKGARELVAAAGEAGVFAMYTGDQFAVPALHRGRVVLLGDSAWCASPRRGLGAALALRDAAALATALTAERGRPASDLGAALQAHNRAMLPVAARARRLPPGRVRSFAPRTSAGVSAMVLATRLLASRPVETVPTAITGVRDSLSAERPSVPSRA